MEYNSADVLIHTREPFNKNTLWIQPVKGEVKVNVYVEKTGWKTIFSTKDNGLSDVSLQQVSKLVTSLEEEIKDKHKKQFDKLNTSFITAITKQKDLERRIGILEQQVKKLSDYSSLLLKKLQKNG